MCDVEQLTNQAWGLWVKAPPWQERLHANRIIACTSAHAAVKLVSLFDSLDVEIHSQAGAFRRRYSAVLDAQRLTGESLAVLPYPVRVDGGQLPTAAAATCVNIASEMSK